MGKLVNNRKSATSTVASAAETHAALISERFRATVEPYLLAEDKAKVPDLGFAVTLIARALRDTNAKLLDAEEVHERELADDAAPREARDAATEALVGEVVSIRETVKSIYGPPGLRLLGLEGSTPTDPQVIETVAGRLLKRLKDKKLAWPEPRRKGISVDHKAWIDDLEAPLVQLQKALVDVNREQREAQVTGEAKARAMDANDSMFVRGAGLISAALRFIAEENLAARVRPSARRPGTTLDDNEDEGEGQPPADGKAALEGDGA